MTLDAFDQIVINHMKIIEPNDAIVEITQFQYGSMLESEFHNFAMFIGIGNTDFISI